MQDEVDELEAYLAQGRVGGNIGRHIRSPKLSRYLSGLQVGRIGIVGGQPGTGKTAWVDDHLVFEPMEEWLRHYKIDFFNPPDIRDVIIKPGDLDIELDYFSMEITAREKLAKFIVRRIYFDIGEIISSDYILGRMQNDKGEPILPTPDINALVDKYIPLVRFLKHKITFHEVGITAKYVANIRNARHDRNGEFETYDGKMIYYRNNPKKLVYEVFDHVGLFKREEGKSKKITIDDISADTVTNRNVCNESTFFVVQFNRSIEDVNRAKLGVEPQSSDFKDTGNLYEDANWALGLFNPYKFKIKSFLPNENGIGYDTLKLKEWFRSGHLLKNRDGLDAKIIPYHFIGACGITNELPPPGLLSSVDYDKLRMLI